VTKREKREPLRLKEKLLIVGWTKRIQNRGVGGALDGIVPLQRLYTASSFS